MYNYEEVLLEELHHYQNSLRIINQEATIIS